jgi:hypothetical protein
VTPLTEELIARLRDLALVELDTLVGRLDDPSATELIGAYVADLEEALAMARTVIRETHAAIGAGPDPLGLVDRTPEIRARGGDGAVEESIERLGDRAAARRELALLEELVRGVLPRLLEADRRLTALS